MSIKIDDEIYDSQEETAAELHVHVRTLIRWRNRGDGPPLTRIGCRPYYRRRGRVAWAIAREQVQS